MRAPDKPRLHLAGLSTSNRPSPTEEGRTVRREKSNYVIQSVSHALDVLEQFTGHQDELGVTELSKRLKLHKNNVFRLLATLEARGYIEQNKLTENYRLGVRCLYLGQRYLSQLGLVRQARPVLRRLARESGETALLVIFRNGQVVPIEASDGDQPVRVVARVGEPAPLHCTAAGKVALAFGDPVLREALPERLEKPTPRTLVDKAALFKEADEVTRQGYARETGEWVEDAASLAVPVRDYTGALVAALVLSVPVHRFQGERVEGKLVPLLVAAGQTLSERLGFVREK